MTKIRDLIPKTTLDKWNGEHFYISKLGSLDNESTLWVSLINRDGSSISIAFDLHEGVEINK